MGNKLLIFDLDDTIFETKSIGSHHVEPIISSFIKSAQQFYKSHEIDSIIEDLWKLPFDAVSSKHQFDNSLNEQFSSSVNDLEYQLDIHTFEDFRYVLELQAEKILVTTGFKKLQLAKIKALNLEGQFDQIHIDEIDDSNRMHKKGIFEQILNKSTKEPQNHFVIGDNPNSEIKAGHELGFTTVQVAKFDQPKSKYSNHYITHFQSLREIITNV